MTAQGNESQLDSSLQLAKSSEEPVAQNPSHSQNHDNRAPTENAPQVKAEVDDDLDLDSRNLANAPFVNKVWRIVNDPANHKYIRWVPGGKSIQIVDREGFEKQLLPFYFKHKRFTSFVRQLNMYGWHKVQDLSAGTMQSSEEHWQFANPNFMQGHPELLRKIVRNKGHKPTPSAGDIKDGNTFAGGGVGGGSGSGPSAGIEGDNKQDLKAILKELEQIKSRQIHIGEDLGRMRKDNELLWTEYYQTRERYDKHSQMLSRILRFLATVYGNQSKILDLGTANAGGSDRVLRAPTAADGRAHQQLQQQYMGLLPASDVVDRISPAESLQSSMQSSMHDLREIEQMQHQIEEANTPSSRSGAESLASLDTTSEQPPAKIYEQGNSNSNSGGSSSSNTPDAYPQPDVSRALVPSRRSSQAIVYPANAAATQYAAASSPSKPSAKQRRTSPVPGSHNQLVRANLANSRPPTASQPALPLVPPAYAGQMPAAPSQPSPQLQEIPDDLDDPDKLFPELDDLAQAPNMPPLTSQELEQISREVASNGMSLQNIQEWLSKQNLDNFHDEDQFNVDDFLTEDGTTQPGAPPRDSENVAMSPKAIPEPRGRPDRKRVRVG